MKVYLATAGEYSDYRVCHVFRNREDAEAYQGADDVEEYELRGSPVEQRKWHRHVWQPGRPDGPGDDLYGPNPWWFSDYRDFDGDPRHVDHSWDSSRTILTVQGWDWERVLKVYSEQRAQYLARQQDVSI